MTLGELLQQMNGHLQFPVLEGDPAETLAKAQDGTHGDPIVGEIVRAIAARCERPEVDCPLERASVIASLGPMRLKYMADDAPVEGFRKLEQLVQAIDAAFNDEALRLKQG
ncbi:hypothetical protein HUS23_04585 [Ectothiorhodospiraceae bacterium 2226]|nr:hypothetical protein HUS23_04585 [Ectothiorhodospiraceae bacterium 2226]